MKSMWNEPDARAIRQRVATLRSDAQARWGKFNAPQMVCHLTDAARMAMGELHVPSRRLPIRYFPLKQLILYVLPFPKGAPTAPELIGRVATTWGSEVGELEQAIERLLTQRQRQEWPDHPAFGPLSRDAWGVLVYRHTDHHLRQFGV
jgi:hypothetical protein